MMELVQGKPIEFLAKMKNGKMKSFTIDVLTMGREDEPVIRIAASEKQKTKDGKEWDEAVSILFKHGYIREVGIHDESIQALLFQDMPSNNSVNASFFSVNHAQEQINELNTIKKAFEILSKKE